MPVYRFSPNQATAEERRRTFVARQDILKDLLARVSNFDSGAQHCILIGPRGIGKTHLLLLLADTIDADENLGHKWVVVRFAEEEYSITTLAEFFLRIIELIPGGNTENIGRNTDLALAYISDYCTNNNKHVLLLMDNMQLYLDQFSDVEISKMREILTSKSLFLIVGAAPSYFKQMQGYNEAFYNFFEPIHLGELNHEETEEMLKCRADIDNAREFIENFEQCKSKIATTTQLTGGNPRLILMLYQVMCESGVTEAANAFRYLLDELTPYFQERMNSLPPQMRKVLDVLAGMASPSTPTEISKSAGMSVQKVSSQLKRLEDNSYVRKVKLKKGKETRYEVTERLYRMWREMRTETGKARLKFLIRFLNLWYSPNQMLNEAGKLLEKISSAQEHERQKFLTELDYLIEASPLLMKAEMKKVYSYAETKEFELATSRIESLKVFAGIEEYIQKKPDDASAWMQRTFMLLTQRTAAEEILKNCVEALKYIPDDSNMWAFRALSLAGLKRESEAIECLDKVKELKPDNAMTWGICGPVLSMLGKYEDAILCYDEAIQISPDFAEVWNQRGEILHKLSRYEEALESYDRAVQIKPDYAKAWYNRGLALCLMDRDEEAFESFDKAVQIKPDYIDSWIYRGGALENIDRDEKALESFDKAIEIRHDDAIAWFSRGYVLRKLERHEEALNSFDRAIEITPKSAIVWSDRGFALYHMGKYKEALESYDKAVQIDPGHAEAWGYRGWLMLKLKKYEEAITNFDKVIQIESDNAIAWLKRSVALNNLNRHDEAMENIKKAEELAKEQGLKIASQFSATSLIETSLIDSLKNLSENNLGLANSLLIESLKSGKEVDEDDLQLLVFGYVRSAINTGKLDFIKEAIGKIAGELGEDYGQLLRPFVKAIDYMQTDNVGILERLQVEEREIVQEIVKSQK